MTKIVFFRSGGVFYGFEEQGHTGYGESGDDILCAALSAMTMLILNTVEISYAGDVIYDIDDTSTRVTVKCMCALPEFEADEKSFNSILVLEGAPVISGNGTVNAKKGDSIFIGAGSGKYTVEGKCTVILTKV